MGKQDDVDVRLPAVLSKGVPTGIQRTIPPSRVFHPVNTPDRPPLELMIHEEPWGSGKRDPSLPMRLEQEDVQLGFAEWLPGGLDEARARFRDACAAGGLGVVQKEGSAPRLVGPSTVSKANRLSRIAEKIELPSLQQDVSSFLSRHDGEWIAFILAVAKAHKRVKVAAAERGYSLFAVTDADGTTHWLCYRTCHFGCSWAAYWWARTAGAFVRIVHRLIHRRHLLAIYVDDILAGPLPKK